MKDDFFQYFEEVVRTEQYVKYLSLNYFSFCFMKEDFFFFFLKITKF